MAVITIQILLGFKRILLANTIYILAFYINLTYLKKFNKNFFGIIRKIYYIIVINKYILIAVSTVII